MTLTVKVLKIKKDKPTVISWNGEVFAVQPNYKGVKKDGCNTKRASIDQTPKTLSQPS